jgi:hypothetical protein
MMTRPSFRLVQRATRSLFLHQPIPTRAFIVPSSTISLRYFTKESTEATVTITDDASTEHHKQSDPSTEHVTVSEFTQEVKITMPDMGESTGKNDTATRIKSVGARLA